QHSLPPWPWEGAAFGAAAGDCAIVTGSAAVLRCRLLAVRSAPPTAEAAPATGAGGKDSGSAGLILFGFTDISCLTRRMRDHHRVPRLRRRRPDPDQSSMERCRSGPGTAPIRPPAP